MRIFDKPSGLKKFIATTTSPVSYCIWGVALGEECERNIMGNKTLAQIRAVEKISLRRPSMPGIGFTKICNMVNR